jgi:hypothetical protein
MLPSIPASNIVRVNPAVISAGGTALSLNTVVLTDSSIYPINQYASAADVGSVYGYGSDQYKFAQCYFDGYVGSTIKPSALFIARYNKEDTSAQLIGASVKTIQLDELQTVKGELALTIDGTAVSATVDLTSVTSFSDAAAKISSALTHDVTFDTQLQAFIISSRSKGANSAISFAAGAVAEALKLTESTGAIADNATLADSPDSVMERASGYTLNYAVITTIGNTFGLDTQKALAKWNSKQNSRYWFVYYAQEPTALIANNTNCFASWLKENAISGTTAIYGTLEQAGLACGYAASINFSEMNGRATMEFKRQSGIAASITALKDATALESNGYAYYGAWATANDRFIFFRNTKVSGDFAWVDTYLNQVYFNAQLQLAFMNMLISYKAIPYNPEGIAIHRAAAEDPIKEMINFGGIQRGVNLSEAQKAQINYEAGFDAARQIETTGYCLLIQQATAQVRGNRGSLPLKLWYTDGGSVHTVNLASINVQ